MTIVFLARRFYPLIGGVEKHVMEVGKRLAAQGHKIVVITEMPLSRKLSSHHVKNSVIARSKSDEAISSTNREKINGIEIIRIPVERDDRFKKFRVWKELWKLREVIKKADVIHCHDVFFWYLPFRFLYLRKRVYTTFHGYESYPIRKGAIVMRKISEKLSMGNICIGDFIAKWYGTAPTYVSYGAVQAESHQVTRLQAPERSDGGQVKSSSKNVIARKNDEAISSNVLKGQSALFFGRLDDQTGILEYIKAFEILKKKFPKFELLVVGDGEQKKLVEKKVKVVGFQENPEKYFVKYNFAFVSRYLSILEAFAAKRLVIATYDNPIKEDYLRMAPYAKWIIIEKDPNMIAKRVEEFLANPEKEKQMVESAYKWVQKQTWEEMVSLYLRLWKTK